MHLSLQKAIWLATGLILPAVIAQSSSPGGPVHEGQPENCNGWHTVVKDDTCQNVSQRYSISLEQFLEWNPAVSSDCRNNFWIDSAYCVRIGKSSSKPATSISSTSISKATSKATSTTKATSQATITSVPATPTTSYNSTYSVQHPVTSWNVSTTSTDKTWPPTKTLAGQTTICNAWHRVVPGDTCQRLLDMFGLQSVDDFLSWNPAAKEDCEMLIADYWVCVGVQRQVGNTDLEWETAQPEFTAPPEPTEYTPVTLPTADSSFTPTPSHGPMPSNCKVFHQAIANQNCNDLVTLYSYFSQEQFLAWNPALDGNCLGLWLDTWYCVGAYSDDNLPQPAHRTTKPTEGNIPLGYPADCSRWYQASSDEACDLIALMFGSFSVVEFVKWNPSVFSDCSGIVPEAWYCVGRPGTPTTRTPGAPTQTTASTQPVTTTTTAPEPVKTPSPVREGMTEDCVRFYLQQPGEFCWAMASGAGISLDRFYEWNPAVGSDCENLWPDYYYCIGV
ncbi:carbohydrate-binding module family 50 protein [Dothidotthia symphoricarpi CBS 119687]|uniref:Carbohydrate-binding module family 50 protein n=1 Tax=Dothidotthia symphoricarpi CBS 119687 TaxID=1392245 RepID=A0A6A6A2D6_9PLEO|nr:carbohydrate-binding module family 50 protein [Dothidotthia symphoricarpi CBS 119687]KAF2124898.1 carbohydrate-binding module family 50 protein [Dothidotthia symphoricarpi CBS 119687]